MNKIIFTDIDNEEGVLAKPKPATEYIPQWYKDAKPYLGEKGKKAPTINGTPYATVKKCMPVWDLMTAGYIIETPYDIYIRQTPEGPYFEWVDKQAVAFQSMDQFQNHPYSREINYAVRIVHPWAITTPKGWSILVCEPQHHEPGPIIAANGIVDTDEYHRPFNMFLKLRDPNFEGMIPAGTPFVQVIPFKRENWVSKLGGQKELKEIKKQTDKFSTVFFDRYKKFWWQRKEYK
jgi:hypothetical protein